MGHLTSVLNLSMRTKTGTQHYPLSIIHYPRVSPGDYPADKRNRDSGYDIAPVGCQLIIVHFKRFPAIGKFFPLLQPIRLLDSQDIKLSYF